MMTELICDESSSMNMKNVKQIAAKSAVNEWCQRTKESDDTLRAIGIGSGSTIVYVIERFAEIINAIDSDDEKMKDKLRDVSFIPTSFQSRQLIIHHQLRIGDLDQTPCLDVAFDGADEVDMYLNCIKGGGGAHLQEKIVAFFAKEFIVVADFNKESTILGEKWLSGVPLEVVPSAYVPLLNVLQRMHAIASVRMARSKTGPVVTDNGNFIIDAVFGRIADPIKLDDKLVRLPGIVATGLFVDMCSRAYFGQRDGSVTTRHIQRYEQ